MEIDGANDILYRIFFQATYWALPEYRPGRCLPLAQNPALIRRIWFRNTLPPATIPVPLHREQ
jgi:hypothetical protein